MYLYRKHSICIYETQYETNTEVLPYNTVHLLYEVILRYSVYVVTFAINAVSGLKLMRTIEKII